MDEIKRPDTQDLRDGHTKTALNDPYGAAEISPTLARYQAMNDQAVDMANYQEPSSENESYSATEPEQGSERVPIASVDGVDVYSDPRPHSDLFDRASRVYSRSGRRLK